MSNKKLLCKRIYDKDEDNKIEISDEDGNGEIGNWNSDAYNEIGR
ncbi:9932_t:CDS:2 [Entrophospora sp. SA101]|nr:9932_t:CDS:2 [Entrophospora sp. SA101]